MNLLPRLRWLLLSAALIASCAFAAPMTEEQKIEAMIHSVEVLPGAQFIRNGSAYDGKAAADHLRSKRQYAGSRIKTAQDFIEGIASHSSMSGQPYQVRFADGKTENAGVYFHDELRHLETPDASATAPMKSAP
ncbi:MAG TPA: DUF5329 domain-containing protein [Xanthomonadaceae bacterium]